MYIIQKRYVSSSLFLYHDTYLDDCLTIYYDTCMWCIISPLGFSPGWLLGTQLGELILIGGSIFAETDHLPCGIVIRI